MKNQNSQARLALKNLIQIDFIPYNETSNTSITGKSIMEVLYKIRDRPRVNPMRFGLPDSTILIREDRNR